MTWNRSIPVLAITAALALTGCGGSSKSSSSTSSSAATTSASGSSTTGSVTSPAVSSFVGTLGALCVRANNAFNNAHGVKAQAAVVARYVAKFQALKPPAQLRALYARYVTVLQLELAALKTGNTAGLGQLVRTRARPLVKKLGATGCVT